MKLLFVGDLNFRGIEPLDMERSAEILSDVRPVLEEVDFRIINLETPLADPTMLAAYYQGWSFMHSWCPKLTVAGKDGYNAAGNFNLINCDAHCDQLKTILSVYYHGEAENARIWAKQIEKLKEMPVD